MSGQYYKDLEFIKNEVSECSLTDVYSMYTGWIIFGIMYMCYHYFKLFSPDLTSATLHDFFAMTVLGIAVGNILKSTIKILTCMYVHKKKLNVAKAQ